MTTPRTSIRERAAAALAAAQQKKAREDEADRQRVLESIRVALQNTLQLEPDEITAVVPEDYNPQLDLIGVDDLIFSVESKMRGSTQVFIGLSPTGNETAQLVEIKNLDQLGDLLQTRQPIDIRKWPVVSLDDNGIVSYKRVPRDRLDLVKAEGWHEDHSVTYTVHRYPEV